MRWLAKEQPDMLTISSASSDDFSKQVLKQMAWLQQELAKAEQRELDVAELTSIRGAILKSLEELRTFYKGSGLRSGPLRNGPTVALSRRDILCSPPHAESGDHGCM